MALHQKYAWDRMKNQIIWIFAFIFLAAAAFALEIKSGTSEDLTIFLRNSTSGAPAEGADCVLDIWNPNSVKIVDDGAMTELGEGFYYYSTLTGVNWSVVGNYRVMAKCTYGSQTYYSAMMYSVVQTTVTEWFEEINQTTHDAYDYLQNTLYPAVDTAEASLADLLDNQSDIWNKLIEIQGNVTASYNEIINTQTQLGDVNDTVMAELVDHRNKLIEINSTVTQILDNITATINPKLDQLQTDVDLIKGYTDTLEAGQVSILGNLSDIQAAVDALDSKTDTVTGYVDTIEDLLNCNSTTDTPICNKLDVINSTVNTINANTDTLESGQTTIIGYTDTLEAGQTTILSNIADLKTYLNCSTKIMDAVCWRLELIQNYTDTLEAGQQTIQDYVDTLETNQTLIISKLNTIEGYTDSVESWILQLNNTLTAMNISIEGRFDAVDANLSAIYADIQTILTSGVKLDSATNATLYGILGLAQQANTTTVWIQNYLNGTITQYLADINSTISFTMEAIGGTEYATGEEVKLALQLIRVSQNPVTDATCTYAVYYPNNTLHITGTMSYLTNGIYNASFTAPSVEGIYIASYNCTSAGFTRRDSDTFHVASWANQINATYSYLTDTIYPKIIALELKLNQTLDNNTQIWNKLVEIQANVTTSYAEIINTQALLGDINDTIMAELAEHKNRLIELNTTVHGILNNITQTVNPKLDQLQTDVDLIKGYTDTLESGQAAILGNLSDIQTTVNSIDSKTNTIIVYVDSLEDSLNCNSTTDTPICNKLDVINSTVNTINANTDTLESGQTTIMSYTDTLESGQTTIQNNIADLKIYLNCSTKLMDSVCWRLELIQNYTDTLEAGQQTIQDYVDTLETNQSLIISKLNTIEGYTDSVESWILELNATLAAMNISIEGRFDAVDADLSLIYSEVQAILANQTDINASQAALLSQILTLTASANTTADWIQDYLNGTITQYLADINQTVTSAYSLLVSLNTTINSIYSDTQDILTRWGSFTMQNISDKLDTIEGKIDNISISSNNTDVLDAINNLESVVNATRDELGFEGQSLTAYEYFVKLDGMIVNVNQTLFNKIEIEANATREQISAAIQNNCTQILTKVNANSNNLTQLLNKWGTLTAQDLLSNITANRNKLIEMQAWLDVFNSTEADRHNTTQSFINDLLAWLGIFNQTEAQRHNLTQTKIDSVFSLLNLTYNNSNTVIAMLGYSGISNTLYDDIQQIIEYNNNITILAQELNLTNYQILNITQTINQTVTEINQTVSDIYGYLQNTIYPAVDILESSLADVLNNQSGIWNKLVEIQGNVTTNYNEIINTQVQLGDVNDTIMAELAEHKNRLIEINGTANIILTNLTLAVNPKLDQLQTDVDLIKGYTDTLESGQTTIMSYVDGVEAGIADLDNTLAAMNQSVEGRFDAIDANLSAIYSDTQSMINDGVKLDWITNQTLNNILALTQDANETSGWIQDYLNGTITQYLADINATVTGINQTVAEINQTVTSAYDLLLAMNTTLASVYSDTQSILGKWAIYNMSQIWAKLLDMQSDIGNISTSVNNTDVLNAINSLESIVNATREELNFTGKNITAYEYFVRLENKLAEINQTLFNKIEFEANSTREQILNAIEANNTILYNQLLNNSNDLDELLSKWGSIDAQDLLSNITETRDQVIDIMNWLTAFNDTEYERYNSTYTYIGGLFDWFALLNETEEQRHAQTQSQIDDAFAVINGTNELIINLTAQVGYSGKSTALYDDIQTLIAQTANITFNIGDLNVSVSPIDYLLLYEGKNLFALPTEPSNTSIEAVLAGINGSYYRVDYYNQTSGEFKTYNPEAPFGNTLTELTTNRVYWIWMYEDDVLFIE
jgi:hypothetical protein